MQDSVFIYTPAHNHGERRDNYLALPRTVGDNTTNVPLKDMYIEKIENKNPVVIVIWNR